MNPSTPNPYEIPIWMNIFSFIVALILALYKIIQSLFFAFTKSKLDVVLTRELFFRILEDGESLYANVVLVAYDTGALITKIFAKLCKEDGSKKDFPLGVAQIGEKYRNPEGFYKFGFSSTSPLWFIPENSPQRQIYLCEYDSYAELTRKEFQQFQIDIQQIKTRYPNPAIGGMSPTLFSQLTTDIENVVRVISPNIMDKIQIEAGKYSLTLTVEYKQKGKYFAIFRTKKASSKVQFEIQDIARNFIKAQLENYLRKKAMQIITEKIIELSSPEYQPVNIIEVIK